MIYRFNNSYKGKLFCKNPKTEVDAFINNDVVVLIVNHQLKILIVVFITKALNISFNRI